MTTGIHDSKGQRWAKSFWYTLLGLMGLYTFVNIFWWRANMQPVGPDESTHLVIGLRLLDAFCSQPDMIMPVLREGTGHWPPLYYLTAVIFRLMLFSNNFPLVAVNIVYMFALLVSTYGIGRVCIGHRGGIHAMLIVGLYPMIFRYSRFFCPDFALTAMVCVSIWLLLLSEGFKRPYITLLFLVSFIVGMLTKWTYVLFLTGPCVYVLGQRLKQIDVRHCLRWRFMPALVIIGICSLLVVFWYMSSLPVLQARADNFIESIRWRFTAAGRGDALTFVSVWTRGMFEYVFLLLNEGVALFFFCVFLIAGIVGCVTRKKYLFFFFCWYIVPHVVFSVSGHNEARYMMPVLPLFALVSSVGISCVRGKEVQWAIIALVMAVGIDQYDEISWAHQKPGTNIPTPVKPIFLKFTPITEHHIEADGPPSQGTYSLEGIAESLMAYVNNPQQLKSRHIAVLHQDKNTANLFSPAFSLDYWLAKRGVLLELPVTNELLPFLLTMDKIDDLVVIAKDKEWFSFEDIEDYCKETLSWAKIIYQRQTHRFLFKDIDLHAIDDRFFDGGALEQMRAFLQDQRKLFIQYEKIALGDGYTAFLYTKQKDVMYDNIRLSFLNGRLFIACNGTPVTAKGIDVEVKSNNGTVYAPEDALWTVVHAGLEGMEFHGQWDDQSDITEQVRIYLGEKGVVKYDVDLMDPKGVLKGDELTSCMRISCAFSYDQWFTAHENGAFDAQLSGGIVLSDTTNGWFGVMKSSRKGDMAGTLMVHCIDTYDDLTQIRYFDHTRNLSAWRAVSVQPDGEAGQYVLERAEFMVGNYRVWDSQGAAYKRAADIYENARQKKLSYAHGETNIICAGGQCKIYRYGAEVTVGFGLYTSMKVDGIWYDSTNALWSVDRTEDGELMVKGTWVEIPVTQVWRVRYVNEQKIAVQISLKVRESIRFDEMQANLTLPSEYEATIIPLFGARSAERRIAFVRKDGILCAGSGTVMKPDFMHEGGLILSYQGVPSDAFEPGTYDNYFSGVITIDE